MRGSAISPPPTGAAERWPDLGVSQAITERPVVGWSAGPTVRRDGPTVRRAARRPVRPGPVELVRAQWAMGPDGQWARGTASRRSHGGGDALTPAAAGGCPAEG